MLIKVELQEVGVVPLRVQGLDQAWQRESG